MTKGLNVKSSNQDKNSVVLPITREALYAKVWTQPMTTLAIEFGVSSSYLARVCSRMNVPRPERGYWAMLAAGKSVVQPPLPDAGPDAEPVWNREDSVAISEPALPAPPTSAPRKRRSGRSTPKLAVHPLIPGAKELFLKGRETDNGYLKPNKRLLVDLVVSKAGLDQALEIANRLYLTFLEYGYKTAIAPGHLYFHRKNVDERDTVDKRYHSVNHWAPYRPTVVYIESVAIGFTIFELSSEQEVRWKDGKYVPVVPTKSANRQGTWNHTTWVNKQFMPSGRYCIQAYSPYPGAQWMKQWRVKPDQDIARLGRQLVSELSDAAKTIAALVKEAARKAEIERQRLDELQAKWRREECSCPC